MDREPDDSFPDWSEIRFADQDFSWHVFLALEGNADGMGGWKVVDTLGDPWIALPEALRADLSTWRWLRGIGERIKSKQNKQRNAGED